MIKMYVYLSSNEATDMSHITKQESSTLISNLLKPLVIPIPGISTASTNNQLGPEIQRLLLQSIVVNIPRLRINLVGQALEINRGRANLLPSGCIVPVGQMAARRQIEPHDTVVGVEHRRVGGEIGRGAAVWLDIDAPFGGVEAVGLEGA